METAPVLDALGGSELSHSLDPLDTPQGVHRFLRESFCLGLIPLLAGVFSFYPRGDGYYVSPKLLIQLFEEPEVIDTVIVRCLDVVGLQVPR